MKRISVTTVAVSALFCLSVVACSSESGAAGGPDSPTAPGAAGTDSPPSAEAGSPSTPAASNAASLGRACDANFDALLARTAKCGPGSTMDLVPLERSRPSFTKLCGVQGSRPGTGYTAAFRTKCADALATAACNDDDTVVKACWEPRGELARGLPCNTDDQCKDGLCEQPTGAAPGSSCGVCGTPVWKKVEEPCEKTEKDRCEPALACSSYYHWCSKVTGHALGEPCSSGSCRVGLSCSGPTYRCEGAPPVAVGEGCGTPNTYRRCEPGAFCSSTNICARVANLDEAVAERGTGRPHCDSWTTESATGKCIVKEALSCN